MLQRKFVETIKTHLCVVFFFFENRSVYEIMWENIVEPDIPQVTVWHLRIACWIPKATDTLTICNTYWLSAATMVSRTRLNATLYVHSLYCWKWAVCIVGSEHSSIKRQSKDVSAVFYNRVHHDRLLNIRSSYSLDFRLYARSGIFR